MATETNHGREDQTPGAFHRPDHVVIIAIYGQSYFFILMVRA